MRNNLILLCIININHIIRELHIKLLINYLNPKLTETNRNTDNKCTFLL